MGSEEYKEGYGCWGEKFLNKFQCLLSPSISKPPMGAVGGGKKFKIVSASETSPLKRDNRLFPLCILKLVQEEVWDHFCPSGAGLQAAERAQPGSAGRGGDGNRSAHALSTLQAALLPTGLWLRPCQPLSCSRPGRGVLAGKGMAGESAVMFPSRLVERTGRKQAREWGGGGAVVVTLQGAPPPDAHLLLPSFLGNCLSAPRWPPPAAGFIVSFHKHVLGLALF